MPISSLIDPSKTVYPEQWVLSLVAKPGGKNPEHAFLIVEGLVATMDTLLNNRPQFVYRRYDFVVGEMPKQVLQKVPGQVLRKNSIKTLAEFTEEERETYFWREIMKDIDQQEGCQGASWIISAEQARVLDEAVLADQARPTPLDYHLPGQYSVLGPSSSMAPGHNCFTWARAKVLTLLRPEIQSDERLALQWADFLGAQTTRHLKPPASTAAEPTSAAASCRLI